MPVGSAILADNVAGVEVDEYSFAMEYHGPPITHLIPRAVPINVANIPLASVISEFPFPDKLSVPVVQPILAPDISRKFSKELVLRSEPTVSPTSVIPVEQQNSEGDDSRELAPCSQSSTSVIEEGGQFGSWNKDAGEHCDVAHISAGIDSSFTNNEYSNELGILESSGTLGFSGSFGKSREVSGNLSSRRVSNGYRESLDCKDSNRHDLASNESVLSMDYPSSHVSSHRIGECNNEPAGEARRGPIVTFRDIESENGVSDEEISCSEPCIAGLRREPEVKVKKGTCYRCFKGNRFTEKEVCIVCDSKYCSSCLLRAMGSMPEGRKCVACIGHPIDESKRGNLGKCSRMLKRLLNDLEIRQIMKAEKFCEVNQLPPEYVFVNGKPLCHDELAILQSCPNPPKKLKPGKYWYDKVSGLWGNQGKKPSKIISPHMNIGGPIKANASNGNTQVYINGREITKVELRMLQLAGVQCAGNPHFWVNEDGSYQEEGQKNTRGYIWGKAGTKLVCAVLSLPLPSKSAYSCGDQTNNFSTRSVPEYVDQRSLQKLLLIGYSGSGTSTIFKQAKILYKDVPFSEDERENIKLLIQTNVYGYLGILLEGRERFEDESLNEMSEGPSCQGSDSAVTNADYDGCKTIYSICPRLKTFSDWLLKYMASGSLETIFPAATREYAPLIEELWNNSAIQATYKRRSELELLPSVASYFLERAVDISSPDYVPTDLDILYAEGVTSSNGLSSMDFSFPHLAYDTDSENADWHDSLMWYQLIRVQARGFGENCKWFEMFEDVRIVLFCVALSDYDQYAIDVDGTIVNKMLLSKKFFETIVTHPTFDQMDFLLILNKYDEFEDKMERVPLMKCDWFSDFQPVISRHRPNNNSNSINSNPSLGHLGFHHIAVKFKRLFSSLTDRKLYVSLVKGLDPHSVDGALKNAREIMKWEDERPVFSASEYSIYSTEASISGYDDLEGSNLAICRQST